MKFFLSFQASLLASIIPEYSYYRRNPCFIISSYTLKIPPAPGNELSPVHDPAHEKELELSMDESGIMGERKVHFAGHEHLHFQRPLRFILPRSLVMNGRNSVMLPPKRSSNKPADKCDPVKLLGIVLDSSLTWAYHVDYLCAKLSSQIFALRQLKSCVDNSTLRTVYYSLIHKQHPYTNDPRQPQRQRYTPEGCSLAGLVITTTQSVCLSVYRKPVYCLEKDAASGGDSIRIVPISG
nr:unnamed protein product [Callosobruchus chinensis]